MKDFLKLANRFRETAVVDDEFPLHRDRFDNALRNLTDTMPKIVCLCGSTRFYKHFQQANYQETMAGNIVLSVGFYPHAQNEMHGEQVGISVFEKEKLDDLHKRKIDLADEVFVLNVGGYIGDSTRGEIEYAKFLCKKIRYLEAVDTIHPPVRNTAVFS